MARRRALGRRSPPALRLDRRGPRLIAHAPQGPAAALLAAAALLLACGDPDRSRPHADLVLEDVNVVDVEAGRVLEGRRIAIRDGRITAVERAGSGEADAERVVEMPGSYVAPGLWDMHVHVDTTEGWFFPLAVAAGVTGLRDMGGALDRVPTWKDAWPLPARADVARADGHPSRAADAPPLGCAAPAPSGSRGLAGFRPRVVAAGPIVTGPVDDPDPRVVQVRDEEDAVRAVDSLLAGGVDFVKVHDWLSPPVYDAIARRAAARGSSVAGHLPIDVGPAEAADAGQRSIEHLGSGWGLLSLHAGSTTAPLDSLRAWKRDAANPAELAGRLTPAWQDAAAAAFDPGRARDLARLLATHGVRVTPTLHVSYWLQLAPLDSAVVRDPRLAWLPPHVRALLPYTVPEERLGAHGGDTPGTRFYHRQQELTAILHAEGVPLLAGTDTGPYAPTVPGFTLHDELRRLVEAGLTPLDALRTATIEPARFLGLETVLGGVEAGRCADLVILEADPLADVANVGRVRAVVVGGRLLDPAERLRGLERMRREFRGDGRVSPAGTPRT
ncbi:MAG TPA: amidohydrolase family protein [Gemmatimonadota bacterium]